jgi:hypothetical protein
MVGQAHAPLDVANDLSWDRRRLACIARFSRFALSAGETPAVPGKITRKLGHDPPLTAPGWLLLNKKLFRFEQRPGPVADLVFD